MTSSSSSVPYDPSATDANLVCLTCGTQFPTGDRALVPTCPICDDPRQFVPPTGQSFTTMRDVRSTHTNEFIPLASGPSEEEPEVTFIVTSPKFAIGQRAILVRTPAGNVLWDCVTLVDQRTVGAGETERDVEGTGCRLVKLGGHFPGSMALLTPGGRLLHADTLLTTPAGVGDWAADALGRPRERPKGMNTFAFMWSIPNSIPLSGDEVFRMWSILKEYDFKATHGGFMGQDIEDERIKERVLESMQIQTRAIAWTGHGRWKDV